MMENKKTQNSNKTVTKTAKIKQKNKILRERENYFNFYDDIKRGSGKPIDW